MGTRQAETQLSLYFVSVIKNILDNESEPGLRIGGNPLFTKKLLTGAEVNQANRCWRRRWTISSGATEDFDVYDAGSVDIGAGAGKDGLGQSWDCNEIVALIIHKVSGAGLLEINPTAPSNPLTWVPTRSVANGTAMQNDGVMFLYEPGDDGFPVTDASEHIIRLKANGGAVTLDMIILGRNDDEPSSSSSSLSNSSSTTSSQSSSLSTTSSSSSSTISSSSTSTVSSVSSLSSSST